jgi:hypothetical protein
VNEIQNFLIDAFNDLRARRLLPVAAVLVAGLVAAPIVLSKSSSGTPSAPPPATTAQTPDTAKGPEDLAKVTLTDDQDTDSGSSLSAFDVKDPFKPPSGVKTGNGQSQPGETPGGGGSSGAQSPTGSTGGGATGGTGGGTTGGGNGGGTGGGGTTPKTTEFTYVLDVTFWNKGHKRTIKGMQKLDVLPNEANPLLIFMGVSSGGGNAVFLVDATLQTTGEGQCKPSHAECAFLSLGAGSEQEFTNEDGDSYRLRIDQIRKVKVGDGSGGSDATTADKKKSKSARAAVEGSAAPRRFVMPALTDLIEQSGGDSTGDEDRR